MDKNNVNIDLDELFRNKFESSELVPGETVRKNLMRRLGRREFIRFNPSRFNIYYMGSIVAAGVTAAILITSYASGNKGLNNIQEQEKNVVPGQTTVIPERMEVKAQENKITKSIKTENNRTKEVVLNNKGNMTDIASTSSKTRPSEKAVGDKVDSIKKAVFRNDMVTSGKVNDLSIQRKPIADFNISSSSGCTPLKVKFINRSASFDSCVWKFGDGGYSRARDPEWIFDVAGEYKVTLQVFGMEGEKSIYTKTINVYPKPVARFETLPEKPILPDDEIRFVNNSRDAVKYKWEFGDSKTSEAIEPVHKYSRYTSYNVRLIAWSQHGCSDSMTLKNAFSLSGCYIDFPNAFIPNPDGPAGGYYSNKSDESAQIFHPVTSGVADYQLRVFSKMGKLIFESNDINIGWDGYNKGQLCEPGVYVWKVRGTYKNGEPFVKMGDITLLKN